MKHTALLTALLAAIVALASPLQASDTLYVTSNASSGADGQSWVSAMSMNDALGVATEGDQIWIGQGAYVVDGSVAMPRGVRLYGGFQGTEVYREHRDWFRRPTKVALQGTWRWENHDSTTRIDGLEFHGPSGSIEIDGGQPAFYNCRFTNFDATPIQARNVGRLSFEYCMFDHNRSRAVHVSDIVDVPSYGYGPFFGQTLFWENSTNDNGAAIALSSSKSTAVVQIVSCVFNRNTAAGGGGAIWTSTDTYITNSTLIRNTAGSESSAVRGHALYVNGPVFLQNSIVWNGNLAEPERLIAVDTAGGGQLESVANLVENDFEFGYWTINPDVIDIDNVLGPDGYFGTDDDGLRPSSQSVALDAGVIDRFVNHNNTDVVGNPRLVGRRIDMGAYEQQREGRLSPPEVMQLLQQGRMVVFFRHAKTDWGQKDRGPSPECFPGRNLILEGREQSHEIGRAMEVHNVPVGDAFSSTACRCWETLDLMVGRYEKKSYWAGGDSDAITEQRWTDLRTIPTTGNRVISTHDAVANAVFNRTLDGYQLTTAELMEGDCLMVLPDGDTAAIVAQWCSDTWERYRVRFPEGAVSVAPAQRPTPAIVAYPNPAADHVTIQVATPQRVVIADMLGRAVWSGWVQESTLVPLAGASPGMYVVRGYAQNMLLHIGAGN